MQKLINDISTLDDTQTCKAVLWLIDRLKEDFTSTTTQNFSLDDVAQNPINILTESIEKFNIHEITTEEVIDKDFLVIAKNLLSALARDDKYSDEVKTAIQSSTKTRMITDPVALLSALKSEIGIGLILILSLRSIIRIKFIKDEEGKKRFEIELEIGKKGALIKTLQDLLKK